VDGPPPRTVAVIGGGIAGLAAAWELTSAAAHGLRVIVLESAPRLGGKLLTGTIGGQAVDLGPDCFVARRPEAWTLCAELGLDEELVAPGRRGAYVWARGRLRPLPAGLALGVPTRLGPLARSGICSPAGLVRPVFDLARPSFGSSRTAEPATDRSVGDIVRRRLGSQVTERLVGPLIGGIHAGPVDTMSAEAVFAPLLAASGRPGSLMRALRDCAPAPDAPALDAPALDAPAPDASAPDASGVTPGVSGAAGRPGGASAGGGPVFLGVRGGLGRLVDRLARALEERGVELRTATPVQALTRTPPAGPGAGRAPAAGTDAAGRGGRWTIHTEGDAVEADGVVVAVPGPAAATLFRPHDKTLADTLGAVAYASVAIVTLRFPAGAVDRALDGTGFLVPAGGRHGDAPLVTACTWLSSKWPQLQRPGEVIVRASAGRYGDDRNASLTDDALVARCIAELGTMMGVRGTATEAVVTRWPGSFPQYTVGHRDRVAAVEAAAAALPSTAVAGAALHGIGIPACIGSGRRAARAVLGGLGAVPTVLA
jgi:protoporphyrinogen/coproporphyrinogen III oxidase